ncbi:hypothetical protein CFN78_03450 [Amycolatopsis antarctica]|uniref:LppX_LprAFG lipoprotein n=1 Tax=Amycolatopsis antarctica TaxID=1854586 RepID=A0A263D9N7_9PSEU|nr:LppX_LprAFG lipoprotein [Amycolatopsis antarctica]OZM75224.1 hypothetical protein CFN78_03450 [Amycolatopsis antarctica]
MPARRRLTPVLLLVISLLGACGMPDTSGPLPDSRTLLDASAEGLRDLRDVRFDYGLTGEIPGVLLRSAHGRASANGAAEGEAEIETPDGRVARGFVVESGTLTLRDPAGPSTREPVPAPAPATLLDADRGLRSLLTAARSTRTENREEVDGVSAYRVGGTVGREVLARLLPGVWADADLKFWIAEDDGRELRRLWLQLPARQDNRGVVAIELALADHNAQDAPAARY